MLYGTAIAVGFIGAICAIAIARRLDAEQRMFGWCLIIAAFWYIGFGLANGQSTAALTPQFAAAALFLALAVLGLRKSMVFTGVGWVLHIFWDYLGPLLGEVAAPWWTAPACLGFDVVVGEYVLARSRGLAPLAQSSA